MAITALTDLETVEVSLVPAGANLKKRFPIMKRTEEHSMSDILHAVIDAQTSEESHFENIVKSADLSEEAAIAVKGAMKILSAYSDAVPAEQAIAVVSEGLGIKKDDAPPVAKQEDEEDEEEKKEIAELSEMITEAEEEGAAAAADDDEEEEEAEKQEKVEVNIDVEEEEEEEEVEQGLENASPDALQKSLKKLAPAVRAQMTALWKSQKDAIRKAEKLEKSLAAERDERLRREFIQKAQKEFRFVPGKSPEELGLMLKSLYAVDSQIAKDIEGIFKSVSAMVEKGDLLDELGSSMSGEGNGSSAFAKLDSIAKQRVSKSGESYAKAFESAMQASPELYTAYLNEQSAK